MSDASWPTPRRHPELAPTEVHVWRCPLAQPPNVRGALAAVLTAEERARAARFLRPEHRERWIVARGVLRRLLAGYHATDPATLAIVEGPHGKPALADDPALAFNLSHSHELALLAFTRRRALGIDVERLRADRELRRMATRFFTAGEAAALARLPDAELPAAFFRCWTRKEAYVKAKGTGFTTALAAFAVEVAPGAPPALTWVADDREEPARWRLVALDPEPGYAGALCAEAGDWRLRCWEWSPAVTAGGCRGRDRGPHGDGAR